MTTKPKVLAYHVNKENPEHKGVTLEPLIRLSDYEALQDERDALVEALEWLRGAINCTPDNDKHRSSTWISSSHPRIKQVDELLAAHREKNK